jgi:hypothetical protein
MSQIVDEVVAANKKYASSFGARNGQCHSRSNSFCKLATNLTAPSGATRGPMPHSQCTRLLMVTLRMAFHSGRRRTSCIIACRSSGAVLRGLDICSYACAKAKNEQNDLLELGCDALQEPPSRFVQANAALAEKLKGVPRNFELSYRPFEGGFYQLAIDQVVHHFPFGWPR